MSPIDEMLAEVEAQAAELRRALEMAYAAMAEGGEFDLKEWTDAVDAALAALALTPGEALERVRLEGWQDAISAVRASLKDYPNLGGDVQIMTEVERLRREAQSEVWDAVEKQIKLNAQFDGNLTITASELAELRKGGK